MGHLIVSINCADMTHLYCIKTKQQKAMGSFFLAKLLWNASEYYCNNKFYPPTFFILMWFSKSSFTLLVDRHHSAQCAVRKVRCHCIFYGPGIRYSDIFGAPGIRYSVIIKLPCALLQTGHLETVHAPVADTVAYFADLDAPVVDTVTYFGGNHRSRVWKSLKLKKVFFPRTRTSWDKYMFNRIVFLKI